MSSACGSGGSIRSNYFGRLRALDRDLDCLEEEMQSDQPETYRYDHLQVVRHHVLSEEREERLVIVFDFIGDE